MELLDDVDHAESRFVCLEIVLVSVRDGCTVCAKRTIGSKVILEAPDGAST
jgi:hypothetical protein